MGYDGYNNTLGYCNENDIPTFKIYSVLNNKFIDISFNDITGFSPNSITYLQKMNSGSTENYIPQEFNIVSIYPNPFNPITTIEFSIPTDSEVSIIVYNLNGEEITSLANRNYNTGYHQITWDAGAHSSGIYFVKMIAGESLNTQKLMLLK